MIIASLSGRERRSNRIQIPERKIISLWTEPELPKEMPCEKCGELTPFRGLIGAGRLPCVHCGAPHPHTPLRTGRWPTIFLIFFVAAIPVALVFGEGAIDVIFPLLLLLFLVMCILFIAGCIYRRWKGNPRPYSLSFSVGILVAAGSLCALYAMVSGTRAGITPALVAIVVMALITFVTLSWARIVVRSDDPARHEDKACPEKSSPEE